MPNSVDVLAETELRRYVDNTLGSLRIEGFELDDKALATLARYIVGEITLDDVGATFTQHM